MLSKSNTQDSIYKKKNKMDLTNLTKPRNES